MKNINFLDEIYKQDKSEMVFVKENKIEDLYDITLPIEVKRLIKFLESEFYDYKNIKLRILGVEEILNANKELDINFFEMNVIPLIDIMDNDFICYDLENEKFIIYNIIDEIVILSKDTIEELILSIIN